MLDVTRREIAEAGLCCFAFLLLVFVFGLGSILGVFDFVFAIVGFPSQYFDLLPVLNYRYGLFTTVIAISIIIILLLILVVGCLVSFCLSVLDFSGIFQLFLRFPRFSLVVILEKTETCKPSKQTEATLIQKALTSKQLPRTTWILGSPNHKETLNSRPTWNSGYLAHGGQLFLAPV